MTQEIDLSDDEDGEKPYPTCPECGEMTYEELTLQGFIRLCDDCDWYDPRPYND